MSPWNYVMLVALILAVKRVMKYQPSTFFGAEFGSMNNKTDRYKLATINKMKVK
jgi:hypothetical protein